MSIMTILSGLLGSSGSSGGGNTIGQGLSGINNLGPTGMVTNIGQTLVGWYGSKEAEAEQQKALTDAERLANQYYGSAAGQLQPYADLNLANVQRLSQLINSGYFNTAPMDYQWQGQAPTYGGQEFNYNQYTDPGYMFRREQGLTAIEGSAAARGNQLSSTTMQALQKYGSDLAGQEYQNAYNRYLTDTGLAQNLYGMDLGEYQRARQYGLDQAYQNWKTGYLGNQGAYNRQMDLANIGALAAPDLASLYIGQGNQLGNIALGRGAVASAGTQSRATTLANLIGTFSGIGSETALSGSGPADTGYSGGNLSGFSNSLNAEIARQEATAAPVSDEEQEAINSWEAYTG